MSAFLAARIGPDARLERSLLGTDDPGEIWRQVRATCPEAVECFAYRVSVGAVFGLRLRDGARVALKVHERRREVAYLEAVQRVQSHLVANGFPCPRPLGVRGRATLEEWRDDGVYRDAHEPEVRRALAEQLARLVRLTGGLRPPRGMEPFFPGPEGPLWPVPHNVLFDFDASADDAGWIDEIARAAKRRRDARPGALVIGHGDWTSAHVRFDGLRPTVAYDWDGLETDAEPVFVGGAAATHSYNEELAVELWPSPEEAAAFVDDYERARGRPFSPADRSAARAAAVYTRAYSTRCVHALGGDAAAMRLREYAAALLE